MLKRASIGVLVCVAVSCAGTGDDAAGDTTPAASAPASSSPASATSGPETTAQAVTTTVTTSTTSTTSTTTPPSASTAPTCRFERGSTTLTHAGLERTALFIPTDAEGPAPLLVLFHGFAGVYDEFAANTGLVEEAGAAGVSLLVPLGAGEPPTWEAQGNVVDDVGFLNTLLEEAANDPCLDASRLWLAGYSAGAGFAGRMACESKQQLAGVVMNAAVFPAVCDPGPIDVIVTHGTDDLVVPYTGLNIGTADDPTLLPSTPDLTAGWAESIGCGSESADTDLGAAIQTRWTGCSDSTVDLVTYIGGGHRWPGRPSVGGEGLVVAAPDLTCIVLAAVNGADNAVNDCAS